MNSVALNDQRVSIEKEESILCTETEIIIYINSIIIILM